MCTLLGKQLESTPPSSLPAWLSNIVQTSSHAWAGDLQGVRGPQDEEQAPVKLSLQMFALQTSATNPGTQPYLITQQLKLREA